MVQTEMHQILIRRNISRASNLLVVNTKTSVETTVESSEIGSEKSSEKSSEKIITKE